MSMFYEPIIENYLISKKYDPIKLVFVKEKDYAVHQVSETNHCLKLKVTQGI
jgi:hypothetical protein